MVQRELPKETPSRFAYLAGMYTGTQALRVNDTEHFAPIGGNCKYQLYKQNLKPKNKPKKTHTTNLFVVFLEHDSHFPHFLLHLTVEAPSHHLCHIQFKTGAAQNHCKHYLRAHTRTHVHTVRVFRMYVLVLYSILSTRYRRR